jgi:hypothetical protein
VRKKVPKGVGGRIRRVHVHVTPRSQKRGGRRRTLKRRPAGRASARRYRREEGGGGEEGEGISRVFFCSGAEVFMGLAGEAKGVSGFFFPG